MYIIKSANMPNPREFLFSADVTELEVDGNNARTIRQHRRTYGSRISHATAEEMKALGRDPNIYEKLVKSLAPNIWESDDVKKGKHGNTSQGNSVLDGSKS